MASRLLSLAAIMAALRILVALTVLLAFLAGRETTTGSRTDELTVEMNEPVGPRRVDIYGNQVDQAVSDYRVDPYGGLYERHAPDTAVLKLGPPST